MNNLRFIEHVHKTAGFRPIGYVDELGEPWDRRINHRGWYAAPDGFPDEIFRGFVWQLSSKRGRRRYVAGYSEPWNDGAVVDSSAVYDDEMEAAYAADEVARIEAERQKEFDAAHDARLEYEELAGRLGDNHWRHDGHVVAIREAMEALALRWDHTEGWKAGV